MDSRPHVVFAPVKRRLTIALLAATSLVVTACACNGDDPKAEIRSLVNDYVAAFSAHDGKRACAMLTPAAQRNVQASAGILRGPDCAATLTTVSRLPTGENARKIATYRAGNVVIDGNEAGVIIEPAAATAKPTRVVKVNGKWLIDGTVSLIR